MWGYPEFYIPVPGGYGTEGSHGSVSPPVAAVTMHAVTMKEPAAT